MTIKIKSKCRLATTLALIMISMPTVSHNQEYRYIADTEFINPYTEVEQEQTEPKQYIGIFEITAYAPHDNQSGMCNDGNPNSTATGTYPTSGRTIAVDPRVIEYGTVVYIEGIGERVSEDTGGLIVGNKIDLMVDKYREAIRFGRQELKVWIVR